MKIAELFKEKEKQLVRERERGELTVSNEWKIESGNSCFEHSEGKSFQLSKMVDFSNKTDFINCSKGS